MTAAETCSTISLNRHEPMFGTAPRADVWLLLTYTGAFGERAFNESDLPDPVKRHLAAALERLPHARLQLISPDPGRDGDSIEFYVVHGREVDPFYRRFELANYADLLEVDIDAAWQLDAGLSDRPLQEPLYLVCTNGRRDPCCAQHGLPVFQTMHRSMGGQVRQSSHVGGHRFAANVVLFPHGLCYGRIRPDRASQLINGDGEGQMVLDKLRGRACYSRVVQAGEALLRQEVGSDGLEDYRLQAEQQVAETRWNIAFENLASQESHQLAVEAFTSDERHPLSCRSDKLSPVTTYQLRSHVVAS